MHGLLRNQSLKRCKPEYWQSEKLLLLTPVLSKTGTVSAADTKCLLGRIQGLDSCFVPTDSSNNSGAKLQLP